jgi:tricorn protease-like protein
MITGFEVKIIVNLDDKDFKEFDEDLNLFNDKYGAIVISTKNSIEESDTPINGSDQDIIDSLINKIKSLGIEKMDLEEKAKDELCRLVNFLKTSKVGDTMTIHDRDKIKVFKQIE